MKTLFKSFQRNTQQAVPVSNRICLTRAFVETGDERCPLAGIWSRLPEMDSAVDDEPVLAQPAWGVILSRVLPWRAFHFRVTGFCYRTA